MVRLLRWLDGLPWKGRVLVDLSLVVIAMLLMGF